MQRLSPDEIGVLEIGYRQKCSHKSVKAAVQAADSPVKAIHAKYGRDRTVIRLNRTEYLAAEAAGWKIGRKSKHRTQK